MREELRNQLNWELIDGFMNDFMNDENLVKIFNKYDEPLLTMIGNDLYEYNNKYDFRLCDLAYITNHLGMTFSQF